jgi:hypothetical protein
MLIRSALLACAAAFIASPALAQAPAAQCGEANVRVYFQHGSAALDEMALETLAAAERMVAECDYAELRVSLDASHPLAHARADAIRAAADARAWNAVHVEAVTMQNINAGPEFAEVLVTPRVLPVNTAPVGAANIGA